MLVILMAMQSRSQDLASQLLSALSTVAVVCAGGLGCVAIAGVIYRRLVRKDRSAIPHSDMEIEAMEHDGITHTEEYIVLNGFKFYRQSWAPSSGRPRACVLFVHGINAHGGTLARNASVLCAEGKLKFVAYDLRGHGRSDGIHAYVNNVDELVEDCHRQVAYEKALEENKGLKMFVMGASFGGLITMQYLRKYGNEVAGSILMCPLIKLAGGIHPPKPVELFGSLLRSIFPEMPFATANKRKGFSDPEIMEEALSSPLTYQGNLRIGTGFALKESFEVLAQNLHEIKVPYLVLHGERDAVVHIDGSYDLHQKSTSKDASMKVYPDCDHALFCEPMDRRSAILADMCAWLHERS